MSISAARDKFRTPERTFFDRIGGKTDKTEWGMTPPTVNAYYSPQQRAVTLCYELLNYLAEDPLTCVARGTSVYLENLELWKDTMESDHDEM